MSQRKVSPFISKLARLEAEDAVREHEERYHADRFLEGGHRRSVWVRFWRWWARRREQPR